MNWSGVRWSGGAASVDPEARRTADSDDPIDILRDGLALCTSPRMYVAAFEMDMQVLFQFVVQTLPPSFRAVLVDRFGAFEDLPCGRFSRLYGVLTGLSGGAPEGPATPPPVRVRLVPPYRLAQEFVFLLENASRRAEDDPVRSYWVPMSCVAHGSVTAVDPETAMLDHPSVVYRIEAGVLSLEGDTSRS